MSLPPTVAPTCQARLLQQCGLPGSYRLDVAEHPRVVLRKQALRVRVTVLSCRPIRSASSPMRNVGPLSGRESAHSARYSK